MVTALILGSILLAALPTPLPADLAREDRLAYEEAKSRAGRDADANVRLALWCEAHGLGTERLEHLLRAVADDPAHAAARGLLGMVAYRGQWKHPEEVATNARSDDALQARLAEYNARRDAMPEAADAHWTLGVWCEQNGLTPEAIAHFTAVTRLDPNRADAWARLGCRKFEGRWLSEAQVAAERAEADARRQAEAYWGPRLKQWWKGWLAEKDRRAEAIDASAEALEPRAVPPIRALFANGVPDQQLFAVQLLDRIDAPEATRDLARFATAGRSEEVCQRAIEALSRRDPNEVIDPLVGLMHDPLGVNVSSGRGPLAVAELRVEDEQATLRKSYLQETVRVGPGAARSARMNYGFLGAILAPRNPRTAREQLSKDLRTVATRNATRRAINESARMVLTDITGQDLGPEPESWRRWLSDRRGYAYTSPTTTPKRVISLVSRHTQYQFASSGFHSNCFAQGTPVRTLLGLKPIETLRVGDQVLSEHSGSGALTYQPIVVVYHNPPSPTLKITLDREEIVSTPIHRFWRVGKGWALARDLKPGDTVRLLGGQARVAAVASDSVQPVFNLELAEGHSFFVGHGGALVHDNTRIQPTSEPFDAAPPLAVMARRVQ